MKLTLFFLTLMLALARLPASAEVIIKRITYHGWQNAVHMSNGTVELVFVPQIGRIMRYAYGDGPNLLWENPELFGKTTDLKNTTQDWQNYGGDKLWPAPQNRWGWPPDATLDSGLHTVQVQRVQQNRRLLVSGPPSPKQGIRFTREIALEPTGTGVTITNTLINTSDKEVNWSVWEVTQVDSPDIARMPLHKTGHFMKGYYVFKDADPKPERLRIEENEVLLERDTKSSSKIGGDSPAGWLAAEKAGIRFEVSARVEPNRDYPDDGCALEIYTNPDPNKYIELELLSPIVTIAPGKSHAFVTRWKLSRPKSETGASEAKSKQKQPAQRNLAPGRMSLRRP
jgi:hypothetical protein